MNSLLPLAPFTWYNIVLYLDCCTSSNFLFPISPPHPVVFSSCPPAKPSPTYCDSIVHTPCYLLLLQAPPYCINSWHWWRIFFIFLYIFYFFNFSLLVIFFPAFRIQIWILLLTHFIKVLMFKKKNYWFLFVLQLANVLYSKGVVKVIDFGLAVFFKSGEKISGNNGTPAYMAPEMSNVVYDGPPVDVWALGILFTKLFLGLQLCEPLMIQVSIVYNDVMITNVVWRGCWCWVLMV